MLKKVGLAALFLLPFVGGCYAEAYPAGYGPEYGYHHHHHYREYGYARPVYVAPRPVYVAPPPPARW
jgi:hypothetical protein